MAISTAIIQTARRLGGRVLSWPAVAACLKFLLPLQYHIRDADPSRDLDALALFGTAFQPGFRPAFRASLEQEFRSATPDHHRFLVTADTARSSRLVGYIRLEARRQDWWITGMEVRPWYRRRGIAEALTRRAIRILQGSGVENVCLSVRGDNLSAIQLYEKLGFRRESGLSDPTLRPGDIGMMLNKVSHG
ncbi:MAG: GNAT family N-acetyltransferase [Verrucomicrobia bacterium]|nr:GNAT family N-acetyltransferase [Verrucomicrobiota bacterium]MBU1910461.1 GNAT family N-acetyltransferase [Verrucomicrobiota bacterium]